MKRRNEYRIVAVKETSGSFSEVRYFGQVFEKKAWWWPWRVWKKVHKVSAYDEAFARQYCTGHSKLGVRDEFFIEIEGKSHGKEI